MQIPEVLKPFFSESVDPDETLPTAHEARRVLDFIAIFWGNIYKKVIERQERPDVSDYALYEEWRANALPKLEAIFPPAHAERQAITKVREALAAIFELRRQKT